MSWVAFVLFATNYMRVDAGERKEEALEGDPGVDSEWESETFWDPRGTSEYLRLEVL